MSEADFFSSTYEQARSRFLQAAGQAGLQAESKPHPMKGRDGEQLAMDVAREGHPNADKLLILSSACHGVEGFCGSGVQVAALRDARWREHASRARRGRALRPRAQSLRLLAHPPHDPRERGPEPQLPRLQQAAAGQPGLPRPAAAAGARGMAADRRPTGRHRQLSSPRMARRPYQAAITARPVRISRRPVLRRRQRPPGAT